jgi:predicted transposase/invertase (TIGR01784 family)
MTDKPLISFDYAIKYLLKDKGDYEIVEGFISALLKCSGYGNVKIIGLLDTESNKEDKKSKRSLADLIVEDEEHQKYIIEIERQVKESFIHKACFNTSRLIVDHLGERMDYIKIAKVFHISLLYFPVGKGAIHHGQTIIREIETKERLTVHVKDPETGKIICDATNILPEYFFISVPLFDDRLEKEIDDWLYVMKYDHIPETFHSPYMQRVADKLSILKMTPAERDSYAYYLKQIYNDRDEFHAAVVRGLEKGREEGREEERKKNEAKLEEERKKNEAKLEEERKKNEAKLEEERKKNEAKLEEERKKNEAKLEEERKKNEEEKKEMARKMLKRGMSVEETQNVIGLSEEDIQSVLT